MTERSAHPDDATLLPEEAAHRILARAVELDAAQAFDVPLARLREIAREAGIGGRAFDLAVQEFRAGDSAVEVRGSKGTSAWSRVAPFARNAGAFVAAMAIIGTVNRAALGLGSGWPLEHAVSILANIAGVGLAIRLRGRVAAFVLAVTAIAQLAEYPMHLMFGIGTVQGGATKWALIIASALGLGFGALAHRRKSSSPGLVEAIEGEPEVPTNDSRPFAKPLRALALRGM